MSRSRKIIILTTGIYRIFRGLEFLSDAEIGEKDSFRSGTIDLNMVRNGVVPHPSSWGYGGYNEIRNPPLRYSLIDREQLIACCGLGNDEQLRKEHGKWLEESLHHNGLDAREPEWTDGCCGK